MDLPFKDEATEAAYAFGWSAVRKLPEPVARTLFNGIADQTWIRHGASVQQLEKNLRRVRPEASTRELRELSRASVRSYMRYWCEVFRLPDWSRERIVGSFHCINEDVLVAVLAAGKGAVLALPHMANWDHAGAWVTLTHQPLVTVAERLKPEALYERFLAYRRDIGMEVLPLTGGASPFRILLERTKAGGLICLLGDRDLTSNGVEVSFFGEPTKMPPGPAALALATGAPLVGATLWYEGADCWVKFHGPFPVPEGSRQEQVALLTQDLADAFAEGIAEHPADWHMMQPLWLADLDPERVRRSASAATADES